MAQPYLLAVLDVVGALIRYAILGVLVVVLESERHAGDVAALHQLQRIVGVVRVGQVAAAVDAVATEFKREGVLVGVAETSEHVGHHVRVVKIQDHVGLRQKFTADAARLQNLIHLACGAPGCEVDRAHAEDYRTALNLAALLLPLLWLAQLQAAVIGWDESCLFHA